MEVFERTNALETGGYRTLLATNGSPSDNTALNYDLAFALMARAALGEPEKATKLLAFLDRRKHSAGGYFEAGDRPFRSDATMHLFEAFLACEVADPDAMWEERADELASLAADRLMDVDGGFIREMYDANWGSVQGIGGSSIEPGHQFEWAYLLQLWAVRRGEPSGTEAALKLFQAGRRGVDPVREVVIDELDCALEPTRVTARLWPQTERMKAALALAACDPSGEMLKEARSALGAIRCYLRPEGHWGDVMDSDGRVAEGPAPASTLYHLMTAAQQLTAASRVLAEFEGILDLS